MSTDDSSAAVRGSEFSDGLGLVERLRTDVLWHRRRCNETIARDCQEAADEIERAWAARDAAVADLEAHAEAEVRRAVAAERERWAKLCTERAQLSWAAADQPHAPEVKMQHEAVAMAMEELARELRA